MDVCFVLENYRGEVLKQEAVVLQVLNSIIMKKRTMLKSGLEVKTGKKDFKTVLPPHSAAIVKLAID